MARPITDIALRFWPKVDTSRGESECWLWTSGTNGRYGIIGRGGRDGGQAYAHRVAWELSYGPIPDGLDVCHICDVPLCVNPKHLFIASHTANMRDAKNKGRLRPYDRRGPRNPRAKVTPEQADEIRERYAGGESQTALAVEYGLGQSHVSRIVRGEHWTTRSAD